MGSNGKIRLSSKAYDNIRRLIVTLRLKPGEQIEEVSLAKKLSIGRTPIREALQRLAMEKLLDLVPGRGFFVRAISIDDVKSLFEAMTALEQIIVRIAAQRIRGDQIEELIQLSKERHYMEPKITTGSSHLPQHLFDIPYDRALNEGNNDKE